MEVNELDKEIITLLITMKDELLECNISVEELISKTPEMVDRKKLLFLKMLQEIHQSQYAMIIKVRSCVSKDMWDNYKKLRIKGLTEQELLKQAQLELRKSWFEKRSQISGKTLKNKDQNNG